MQDIASSDSTVIDPECGLDVEKVADLGHVGEGRFAKRKQ